MTVRDQVHKLDHNGPLIPKGARNTKSETQEFDRKQNITGRKVSKTRNHFTRKRPENKGKPQKVVKTKWKNSNSTKTTTTKTTTKKKNICYMRNVSGYHQVESV